MKKVILAVASIALWASCIEDEKDYSQIIETRVANCETSKDFSVPVKEGYTTFVTSGEDTLAMANEPITIRIPKNATISTVPKETVSTSVIRFWTKDRKQLTQRCGRPSCSKIRRMVITITTI